MLTHFFSSISHRACGSIDPSQLQVSLEQTQGPPTTPRKYFVRHLLDAKWGVCGEGHSSIECERIISVLTPVPFFSLALSSSTEANRSSGKSSPLRGRCVKEYEEQLQQLQHENFNLKLRVFLLEERVGKALGRSDAADIIKNNIELKVENETLKKSLTDKCQLLTQASSAIEELESQQRSVLAAHQSEVLSLKDQLDFLQKVYIYRPFHFFRNICGDIDVNVCFVGAERGRRSPSSFRQPIAR